MTDHIETLFLQQADSASAASQAHDTAQKLADFIKGAKQSVHIAIYDLRLDAKTSELVVGAMNEQAEAGIVVRLLYYEPRNAPANDAQFAASGADPAPGTNQAMLKRLSPRVLRKGLGAEIDTQHGKLGPIDKSVETESIQGSHLMHNKYVVRDGLAPDGALWTGSANFTDDAWSKQENNVLIIHSQDLCSYYEQDFNELWASDRIAGTGKNDLGTVFVDDIPISVAFSPGEGQTIDSAIASRISAAQTEVVISCMVISSSKILGAIIDATDRGVPVRGIYDGTQMKGVEHSWGKAAAATSAAKLAQWEQVRSHLVPKYSTPYTPTSPHDFMHNKLVAVDGKLVVTGSFNFSLNATHNAENVLTIESPDITASYVSYVDAITARYQANAQAGASAPHPDAPAGHLQHRTSRAPSHTRRTRKPSGG